MEHPKALQLYHAQYLGCNPKLLTWKETGKCDP